MSMTPRQSEAVLTFDRIRKEIFDMWSISLVEVTAGAAVVFTAAPVWQAIAAGLAAAVVRVGVGLALSEPSHDKATSMLTDLDLLIAKLVSDGQPEKVNSGNWYDNPIVKGTLAAAGFIGFTWTSYQIIIAILRALGVVRS